jgi:hypothetical protein
MAQSRWNFKRESRDEETSAFNCRGDGVIKVRRVIDILPLKRARFRVVSANNPSGGEVALQFAPNGKKACTLAIVATAALLITGFQREVGNRSENSTEIELVLPAERPGSLIVRSDHGGVHVQGCVSEATGKDQAVPRHDGLAFVFVSIEASEGVCPEHLAGDGIVRFHEPPGAAASGRGSLSGDEEAAPIDSS